MLVTGEYSDTWSTLGMMIANKVYVQLTRYTHDLHFVVFCCGLVPTDFTHIFLDYFSGRDVIVRLPWYWLGNIHGNGLVGHMKSA